MTRIVHPGSIALMTLCVVAAAQQAEPRFDVISIKRNLKQEGPAFQVAFQPGGRFVMTNSPLTALLPRAFPDASTSRLVGAPSWLGTDSYDIVAQTGRDASRSEMEEMLRRMLVERFNFSGRVESREEDAYDLVLNRSDGKLGDGLRRIDIDCEALGAAAAAGQPPFRSASVTNGAAPCRYSSFDGGVLGGGITTEQLAAALVFPARRLVVDRTGLQGRYEVTLKFAPGGLAAGQATVGDLPNFFTALQEQLGMRLHPSRTNAKVLIIDRIDRPTEN